MAIVSFIGLGVMGAPMAGHLVKAGHEVYAYNRTSTKAQAWLNLYKKSNAKCYIEDSPAKAVKKAQVVFLCLGNDESVRNILVGNNSQQQGILNAIQKNTIIVDHTTTSANLARESATQTLKHNAFFIDAPISGGEKGAQEGALSVMCGGDSNAYQNALPIIKCYAKQCSLMGNSGAGQLTKMVNQICIAGVIQSLAEALHFAKLAKLDRKKLIPIIQSGAAQSWQMDNRAETMCNGEFNFGFATEWMLKDLQFCIEEAQQNNAKLLLVQQVVEYYKELQKMGHQRSDSSALIARLEKDTQA